MLKLETAFACPTSHSLNSSQGQDFVIGFSSGIEENSLELSVTEITTGLPRGNYILSNSLSDLDKIRTISSIETLIQYHPNTGEHRIFNLQQNVLVDTVIVPLQSGNRIIAACEPQIENGLFLFACEDDSFYALLVRRNRNQNNNNNGTNVKQVICSPQFRLEKAEENKLDRAHGKIQRLVAHPTLPLVFIVFSQGDVQVNNIYVINYTISPIIIEYVNIYVRFGRMKNYIVYYKLILMLDMMRVRTCPRTQGKMVQN
jgi:hypothetical protein